MALTAAEISYKGIKGGPKDHRIGKVKKDDPEIARLAASIRTNGLLNPLTVRIQVVTKGEGEDAKKVKRYSLLAGRRRYAALGLILEENPDAFGKGRKIPVRLFKGNDAACEIVSVVENADRKGLTNAEMAKAFQQLKNADVDVKQIAEMFDVTDTWVYNHLKVIEKCSAKVFKALHLGLPHGISFKEALRFAKIDDEKGQNSILAKLTKERKPEDGSAVDALAPSEGEDDKKPTDKKKSDAKKKKPVKAKSGAGKGKKKTDAEKELDSASGSDKAPGKRVLKKKLNSVAEDFNKATEMLNEDDDAEENNEDFPLDNYDFANGLCLGLSFALGEVDWEEIEEMIYPSAEGEEEAEEEGDFAEGDGEESE